jgi:cation diffusion facilitator CzcD-associated flavoprotein CzcO
VPPTRELRNARSRLAPRRRTLSDRVIETDYLIVGAGAVGMAFADSLLHETEATMVMADRRHRPGGHWNDAYTVERIPGLLAQ